MPVNNNISDKMGIVSKTLQDCGKQALDKTAELTEAKQKGGMKLENLKPPTNNIKTSSPSTKYTEEELQLTDLDGDGEITNEEINTIINNHHKEMERLSKEYDERHETEAGYAWANNGTWSEQKQEYMNAQDIVYREAHPEYATAKCLSKSKDLE